MNIKKEIEDNKMTVKFKGKLDFESAYKLEEEINQDIGGINELNLDFKDLVYISSAGIRVILTFEHIMAKQGKMIITNISPFVLDVFETTGINKILNIQ